MEEKELNTSPQDAQDVTAATPETQPQTDSAVAAEEATAAEAPDELSDADKLAQAEAEIAELKDKMLRQAADFANFRKHSIATQTDLILNGGKKVIGSLLPILDDMDRAQQHMPSLTPTSTKPSPSSLSKRNARKTTSSIVCRRVICSTTRCSALQKLP